MLENLKRILRENAAQDVYDNVFDEKKMGLEDAIAAVTTKMASYDRTAINNLIDSLPAYMPGEEPADIDALIATIPMCTLS